MNWTKEKEQQFHQAFQARAVAVARLNPLQDQREIALSRLGEIMKGVPLPNEGAVTIGMWAAGRADVLIEMLKPFARAEQSQ